MPRPPSINTLARSLGLSRTTVSDALRAKGRVSPETVKRVRLAAKAIGYRTNPLVATVLGSLNRGGGGATFRGALAMIDLHEKSHWPHGPFPRELIAGAKTRAAEMGFSIAEFVVGAERLSWRRLDSILQSRGIHGVIVLPAWFEPDLSQLAGPKLHSVCTDHYASMLALLGLLTERGYRRPGLLLQRGRDQRVRGRQSAAFGAFHTARSRSDFVPPLITEDYPNFEMEFAPWFRRHRPDVVLSHFTETRDWMKACSPATMPGFVLLNVVDRSYPCAALDLQPRLLGARAVEMIVGQILRNEFGVPAWPSHTTVQAKWVEGPTVRPAKT